MKIKMGEDVKTKIEIDRYDCLDLFTALAEINLVALKKFRKETSSYPGTLTSFEEWDIIMKGMIKAFKIIVEDPFPETPEQTKAVEEGLQLYARYFRHLWI